LDRAHLDFLARMAKKSHSSFCRDFLRFIADSVNVRAMARSILIFEEKLPLEAFMPYGKIKVKSLLKLETIEDFISFIKSTDLRLSISQIKETDIPEEIMIKIEKGIDKIFGEWINDSASGEIDSVQIPIRYFEKRLQNARLLKFVMFAKFNGLNSEVIYKALKHF
jgi:vacuolar-type H+-ATPase subunit C/Vma6